MHDDHDRDDGDDESQPTLVLEGTGEDVGALAIQRKDEPGERIGEDAHAAAQGQEYEGDPDQGHVDAGGPGEASTHSGHDAGIRAAPKGAAESPAVSVEAVSV